MQCSVMYYLHVPARDLGRVENTSWRTLVRTFQFPIRSVFPFHYHAAL